jgi:phage baseplate assembly protein W
MSNLGSCWSCLTDLTMPATMATGFRCVAEAIVRRWSTPRGGLVDDPNYGTDVTDLINDDLDKAAIAQMAHALRAEAEKDERVLSCETTVTLLGDSLIVTGKVATASGPFQLVVSVNSVTVSLLQVTP